MFVTHSTPGKPLKTKHSQIVDVEVQSDLRGGILELDCEMQKILVGERCAFVLCPGPSTTY
jgi:hypothetical protein